MNASEEITKIEPGDEFRVCPQCGVRYDAGWIK